MKFNLLVFVLCFRMAMPCEVFWDCKTCIEKKCVFVSTKLREYCENPNLLETITDVNSVVDTENLCRKSQKGIDFKLQQLTVIKMVVIKRIVIHYINSKLIIL